MTTHYPVDDEALVDLATSLARTASVSGAEGAAVSLVTRAMEEAGFDTVEVDGSGNAIGALGPRHGNTIMIDGHIDTIPLHSPERWTVDPFGGQVRDGNLYGLGICDQKASIAAAVHGVAAAAPGLKARVVVVASVCEEEMEGGALAEPIAALRPDAFVTSEPNDTRLCIGQRGRAKVEVTVTGRACHAGHAAVGLNAAPRWPCWWARWLSSAIRAIRDWADATSTASTSTPTPTRRCRRSPAR